MEISRRSLLGGAASCLLAVGTADADDGGVPRLIEQDYAIARAQFRTRLVRKGPAPDKGESLEPPGGAEVITYRSGDLTLQAWLSSDAGSPGPRRPAVLFLHGGNALWHGHWDLTSAYREAGYIAMMPALRAENGQAGFFSGFYDETDDVLAAAETLKRLPTVDPDRIFLAGHSVGGTLTLLGALASPMFRSAAAFSPNPDARAFFRRFSDDVRFDVGDPREFEMRSPACFARSFKCPILMLHGTAETRTEAVIQLTAERARSAGVHVKHGTTPGDHMGAVDGEIAESLRFFAEA